MKQTLIALLILFIQVISLAQIRVEKAALRETVDSAYLSNIPMLISNQKEDQKVVKLINDQILDRFMIKSFKQNELEEFRWYGVDFIHEIKDGILYIYFGGEYYGAYPNSIEEELFFDLNTGKELNNYDIKFAALFSLEGYLDFMNKYWLKVAKPAFAEAIECAEYEPYCSYYSINDYFTKKDHLVVYLTEDCYAHVSRGCSPDVSLSVPLDSIENYLSKEGKQIILTDSYTSKKGVDKYLYNKRIRKMLPNDMFVFGKVDGKYPFSMALNANKKSGEFSGYYYYDRKKEKIEIHGYYQKENIIILNEFVDGKSTGSFKLQLSQSYVNNAISIHLPDDNSYYIKGQWYNPDKTKTFKLELNHFLLNSMESPFKE